MKITSKINSEYVPAINIAALIKFSYLLGCWCTDVYERQLS